MIALFRQQTALVPQARLGGPMPWVIAIMVALTVIAAGAGLALRNTALSAREALSGGITVQVIEADPQVRARQARAVTARLAQLPQVADVRVVPDQEVARLIEPWLGQEAQGTNAIPVPALIDARLHGEVTTDRLDAIRSALGRVAPSASVEAQANWLVPVFSAIESLQWLALALVVLLALALAAAVLLAVRTALGANRDTIEIVHLLGGTDGQIARVFQRSVGVDAASGGVLGLSLGVVVMLLLGRSFSGLGAGLANGGAFRLEDWALLAFIPLAGIALAVLTARITVMRALRRIL